MFNEIKTQYEEIYSEKRRKVIAGLAKITLATVTVLGGLHLTGEAVDHELDRNEKVGEQYDNVEHPHQQLDPVGEFFEESDGARGGRPLGEQAEDIEPSE